ncbi:hypothetical protein NWT39_09980 [Nitrososphaera viennensis]|uniref:Uncharacterized protein n=1 Tax=Nitrososphaera viennensis TaxID=1034015 RepID=A0A977NLV0_9ARCH|nr:hypothetical protein [Nitrososphaera viennensis]UVS68225.1 hypothetical protein NWT39_09980 [Nitrososphaera viennensis]
MKERLRNKLEDFELTQIVLDRKVMDYNKQLDQLKNKINLVSYLPLREKLEKQHNGLKDERDAAYKEYLEFKNNISTIINDIDELDLVLNRFMEAVEELSE